MSKVVSQRKRILKWLQTHKGGLTTFDGFTKFGCTRLAARISELKEEGQPIIDEWEVKADGTRYKRYFLQKGA